MESINVNATQSGTWNIATLSTITNVVHVDDNAGSLTVDNNGTFAVQAAQSGTWNITNITGTITLPTGASTAANQATEIGHLSSIDTDIDVALSTRASETTLSTLNSKVTNDYGVSSGAVRTASQIGNATGQANFDAGITGAQTLRTTSNITRNGTELSYDDGSSDANTLRVSSNLKREGNDLNYNYGTVGADTLRSASQIGNATGAADFNAGSTGAQTLRTSSNISDSAGTAITLGQKTMAASVPVVLASDFTERPTFVAEALDIDIGNNKSMISIVNTSGSTIRVKIREIKIVNSRTTAVTGIVADFRLFRFVSHSAGTLITPLSHDTVDSLDSSITVRTGATIVTEAANAMRRWEWSSDEWGPGTSDVESFDHAIQSASYSYRTIDYTKPITLNANEGIHIKQVINSTAGTFDLSMTFTQEP